MDQRGLAPILIVLLIAATVGGYLVYSSKVNLSKSQQTSSTPTVTTYATPSATSSPQVTNSPSPTSSPKAKTTSTPSPTPKTSPSPTPTPTPIAKITCTISTNLSSGWSPLNVNFNYSASDQSKVVGRQWDLDGDGTWESETSTPNFVYKDVKSYEAKLKLKLSDGSYSDICNKTITVNPPSVICSINALNATSGPAPLAVDFIYGASIYGSGNDYVTDVQWDFNGDGTWDTPYDFSSQHPPAYTYSNPGNYTAKMHLKTNNGLEADICTKSITVN